MPTIHPTEVVIRVHAKVTAEWQTSRQIRLAAFGNAVTDGTDAGVKYHLRKLANIRMIQEQMRDGAYHYRTWEGADADPSRE